MTEKDFVYVVCCRKLDQVRSVLNGSLEKFYGNTKNVTKFLDVSGLVSEVNDCCERLLYVIEEVFK